jgi:hypothetical protein
MRSAASPSSRRIVSLTPAQALETLTTEFAQLKAQLGLKEPGKLAEHTLVSALVMFYVERLRVNGAKFNNEVYNTDPNIVLKHLGAEIWAREPLDLATEGAEGEEEEEEEEEGTMEAYQAELWELVQRKLAVDAALGQVERETSKCQHQIQLNLTTLERWQNHQSRIPGLELKMKALEKVISKELHNQKVVLGHKLVQGGGRLEYFKGKAKKNVSQVERLGCDLAEARAAEQKLRETFNRMTANNELLSDEQEKAWRAQMRSKRVCQDKEMRRAKHTLRLRRRKVADLGGKIATVQKKLATRGVREEKLAQERKLELEREQRRKTREDEQRKRRQLLAGASAQQNSVLDRLHRANDADLFGKKQHDTDGGGDDSKEMQNAKEVEVVKVEYWRVCEEVKERQQQIKTLLIENKRRSEEMKADERTNEARQRRIGDLRDQLARTRTSGAFLHPGEGQYALDDPRSVLTEGEQRAEEQDVGLVPPNPKRAADDEKVWEGVLQHGAVMHQKQQKKQELKYRRTAQRIRHRSRHRSRSFSTLNIAEHSDHGRTSCPSPSHLPPTAAGWQRPPSPQKQTSPHWSSPQHPGSPVRSPQRSPNQIHFSSEVSMFSTSNVGGSNASARHADASGGNVGNQSIPMSSLAFDEWAADQDLREEGRRQKRSMEKEAKLMQQLSPTQSEPRLRRRARESATKTGRQPRPQSAHAKNLTSSKRQDRPQSASATGRRESKLRGNRVKSSLGHAGEEGSTKILWHPQSARVFGGRRRQDNGDREAREASTSDDGTISAVTAETAAAVSEAIEVARTPAPILSMSTSHLISMKKRNAPVRMGKSASTSRGVGGAVWTQSGAGAGKGKAGAAMVSDLSAGQTRQNQGWGTNPPARTQKLRGSHGTRDLAGASLGVTRLEPTRRATGAGDSPQARYQ